MPVQVFLSYARDDDMAPPGKDELKGFVTYLDEQLRYELNRRGEPRPRLWRDKPRIDGGEQFDPKIAAAIADSQLLLVVLSRNWLARPWCRRELDLFRERWPSDEDAKRRIVVVHCNYVAPENMPLLLQGQEGYPFFELDRGGEAGQEQEFFARGRPLDARYETRVIELARYLWLSAARIEAPQAEPAPRQSASAAALPRQSASAAALPRAASAAKGRTVYLAKPAGDMQFAYDRLAKELAAAGYTLAPPPDSAIPHEGDAAAFVVEALATAELSVHLLGERLGYAPEDSAPIVPLQLRCAADRAAAGGLRRVLWVPSFLTGGDAETAAGRDPFAVVARLDRQLDGDTVDSGNLSTFVEFLIQHLERTAPSAQKPDPLPEGATVYVYHRPEDEAYASALASALRKRRLKTESPAFDGDPVELDRFHRDNLRECQAVVLCWANASEVWARATCREWRSWEKLGRSEKFAVRGLIAGPPPGSRKSALVQLPPEDAIDVVIDLTSDDRPLPEALEALIRAVAPGAP